MMNQRSSPPFFSGKVFHRYLVAFYSDAETSHSRPATLAHPAVRPAGACLPVRNRCAIAPLFAAGQPATAVGTFSSSAFIWHFKKNRKIRIALPIVCVCHWNEDKPPNSRTDWRKPFRLISRSNGRTSSSSSDLIWIFSFNWTNRNL